MDKEVWLPMKGYEGFYEVSNLGRVISSSGCMRKPSKTKFGYLKLNLSREGVVKSVRVHRVVAITFLDKTEGKDEVNHLDGDKTNNRVDNLEWCTSSENKYHAVRTGLLVSPRGGLNPKSKLSNTEADFLRYFASIGYTQSSLAELFGISKSVTCNIVNNKSYVV